VSGFAGALPQAYQTYLVPLIFEPYADDLVPRLAARSPGRVLEVAAGTGVVTRVMASKLPPDVSIVATDRNPPMLAEASAVGTARPVEWRPADAMELPFPDASFDAVVCQFGVMFFPDKAKAFSEARRVLRPGGLYLFNVWDRIEDNEFADIVTASCATVLPDNPPRFLARLPHGYSDRAAIAQDLQSGGFRAKPEIDTLALRSRAPSARHAATGYCHGTPIRDEIEAHGADRLEEATNVASDAISRRFGQGAVDGKIQAHVVAVER
jgi:SAM-dependent methyltransferase